MTMREFSQEESDPPDPKLLISEFNQALYLPESKRRVEYTGSNPQQFEIVLRSINFRDVMWLLSEQVSDYLRPRTHPWEKSPEKSASLIAIPRFSIVGYLVLVMLAGLTVIIVWKDPPAAEVKGAGTNITTE